MRRTWALAVALALLAGGCTTRTPPPGPAGPALSTSGPAAATPALPAAVGASSAPTGVAAAAVRLGTVLVVPGYGGDLGGLGSIAAALKKAGRRVRLVSLPASASQSFERQAASLEAAVRAEEKAGHGPVDIVGHSNGGVLARYWARHYHGSGRARVIIGLGSPQHGTELAEFAYQAAPGLCSASCREVRPHSAFLSALNSGDETPAGISWVTVYTDNDDVVTPATSARLSGAVNVHLQAVCATATATHSGLLGAPLVLGIVLDELRAAGPHAETAAACRRLTALGG
ncbi:MAG: triacylglycerol lipase [Frankiaceae bacterium]|jgi:triacylglycerol esterase/lipase EstA (alpha/beta hydrolase family)|nr:triacylglycerol lipase [Frankiaceae bacterium]